MSDSNHENSTTDYNTAINIIGGLRDTSQIYKAIESNFNESDSLNDLITGRNELNLRTERSQQRVQRAISNTFLIFINQDHEALIRSIFFTDEYLADRELILFWQLALTNRLFREISIDVYCKAYFSGRTGITKEDVIGYLKELTNRNENRDLNWSENTIHTLSTKYLNLMTKLIFLEGARNKSFRYIRVSDEALVLFLYFARLYEPANRNILTNKFLPLSFVASEDLLERLKQLSIKGYFDMEFTGVDINIDLVHGYSGVCDVLSH